MGTHFRGSAREPFRDATMDQSVFNASFHHPPDVVATLHERYRVLKPGTEVLQLHEAEPSFRRWLPRTDSSRSVEEGPSYHDITVSQLKEMAAAAGFQRNPCVAEHVERKLARRLTPALGRLAARLLGVFPGVLGQLNGARLRLTTPAVAAR